MGERLRLEHEVREGKRADVLALLAEHDRPVCAQRGDLPVNMEHLRLEKRDDVLRRNRRSLANVTCGNHTATYLGFAMRREVEIVNELGLHARPAAEFVRAVRDFDCDVFILKDDAQFSAGSIIEVLTANLNFGSRVTIEATGRDAAKVLARLEALLLEFKEQEKAQP